MLLPKTSDGRVIFAVPWHGRVLWGTTDTPVREISREPRALPEEIDFLLSHAARYLNNPPSRKDIVSVFAGLRPLVSRKSAAGTASLARDHVIEVSSSGLITITGGKWTTWRHMAEEVISQGVEAILPRRACLTKSLPLDDDFGGAIEALSASEPGLAAPLHPGLPDRGVDVVWHVRETMARSVEDVLIRRTRAAILDARASLELAGPVSRILAWELGWDESRREAEERRYAASAASYLPFGE
jgi:glycerol-3-phosphate dehydrogenase